MSKVKRVCPVCGKIFYVKPSKIEMGRGVYCSRKCRGIGQTINVEKICPVCGKVFYTKPSTIKKGGGVYCSRKCKGIGQTINVEKICPVCGKVFYTKPSIIKDGKGVYCSKECAYIGKTTKVEKTCPVCGKVFYAKLSDIKKGKGVYCSRDCWAIGKTTKVERVCPICGTIFYAKLSDIERNKGVYCSRKCMGIARRGENSPTWKGGISFEPYCILFNKEFKERVRAFFDNKCALCGKTKEENGRSLCIHHVNYDKKTCCNDSERLFVPLCGSCHSKTNGNREQWEEYFKDLIKNEYGGKCYYTKEEYYK